MGVGVGLLRRMMEEDGCKKSGFCHFLRWKKAEGKRKKGLPPEEIGMRASLEEQERELVVILLPRHQPVRLDVALPLVLMVALKLVRLILSRQRASGLKQVHRISNEFHVETALHTTLEVLLKARRDSNRISHDQSPISL